MEMNFSAWLRDTGRLYVRYMAVGLATLPMALAYAMAKQNGVSEHILLPVLAAAGTATAFYAWKKLGDKHVELPGVLAHSDLRWTNLWRDVEFQTKAAPVLQSLYVIQHVAATPLPAASQEVELQNFHLIEIWHRKGVHDFKQFQITLPKEDWLTFAITRKRDELLEDAKLQHKYTESALVKPREVTSFPQPVAFPFIP